MIEKDQIVRFISPISRTPRIGRVAHIFPREHVDFPYINIRFVGEFGDNNTFLMGINVSPTDVFPDVSEENRKKYAMDLLRAS